MTEGRLQFAFGDLNPVEEQHIGSTLTHITNPLDIVRQVARDSFKRDALSNSGAFKGIVLRIENNPSKRDISNWVTNIFGIESTPPFRSLKVRIPEIHAALPEPAKYGSDADASHKVIDMYPTFVAASQDVSDKPVNPGDIVLVDFGNRENLTHPIYLGPIFNKPLPGAVGAQSIKSITEPKNSLLANPPPGDNLGQGKMDDTQIPLIANSTDIRPERLNYNESALLDADDPDHPTVSEEPEVKKFEMAYKKGRAIGEIELVEVLPPNASKSGIFIAKSQEENFYQMVNAAKDVGVKIVLTSGFRTYDQQKYFYDGYKAGRPRFNIAARPGHSKHQSGIAFDFAGTSGGFSSKTYRWLANNAHKFGFINTGKFFKRQTEFWHWEYLGKNNSKVQKEGTISFREKQRIYKEFRKKVNSSKK